MLNPNLSNYNMNGPLLSVFALSLCMFTFCTSISAITIIIAQLLFSTFSLFYPYMTVLGLRVSSFIGFQ